MAQNKINPDKDGKYKLGGSKDTDLEGIDSKKYDVFTETEKLAEAQTEFPSPGYTWFASYTIKDKEGTVVRELAEYTIKFDKPDVDTFQVYYYLDHAANPIGHDIEDSSGKKRVKVKLKVGDPPIGSVP